MSKVQVNILCPNGRRVHLKTEPQKPILMLIEEACLKQGFTPENYDLKHLRRILDPTAIVRYANIPNNAQLELVEAATPRQANAVSVTLATSTGRRLIHDFSSTATLWEILMHHSTEFSPDESMNITDDCEPVIVYAIQKISGDKLKSTTLKSLGLISGKCMLRYSKQKIRDGSPIQPHVSSIMNPRKPILEKETDDKPQPMDVVPAYSIPLIVKSNASQTVISALRNDNSVSKTIDVKVPKEEKLSEKIEVIDLTANEIVTEPQEDACMEYADDTCRDKEKSEFKLIPLCDGDAFLFSEDDIRANKFCNEDDSFFEVSIDEAKQMYKDLVTSRKELENAPLLTGRVRELEKSSRMLATINSYPVTLLRICFPDRYVIQASFKPHNRVFDVINFLRPFLTNSSLDFYLYTLFPRKKLEPESILVDVGCTPKARVYFGSDVKSTNYLKEEVLAKKSTFDAVMKTVKPKRKEIEKN